MIEPESVSGTFYRFAVPEGVGLRLVSRSSSPAEVKPHDWDKRRLGRCVGRIVLDDTREIPLGDASLA